MAGNPTQSLGVGGLDRQSSAETEYDSYWRVQARDEAKLYGPLATLAAAAPAEPAEKEQPDTKPEVTPTAPTPPLEPVSKPDVPTAPELKPVSKPDVTAPTSPQPNKPQKGNEMTLANNKSDEHQTDEDDGSDISLGHSVSERPSTEARSSVCKFDKFYYRWGSECFVSAHVSVSFLGLVKGIPC